MIQITSVKIIIKRNNLRMDKDALVKIKRTTAGFKGEIKHDDWSVNLRSFKEIREAFCATC